MNIEYINRLGEIFSYTNFNGEPLIRFTNSCSTRALFGAYLSRSHPRRKWNAHYARLSAQLENILTVFSNVCSTASGSFDFVFDSAPTDLSATAAATCSFLHFYSVNIVPRAYFIYIWAKFKRKVCATESKKSRFSTCYLHIIDISQEFVYCSVYLCIQCLHIQ